MFCPFHEGLEDAAALVPAFTGLQHSLGVYEAPAVDQGTGVNKQFWACSLVIGLLGYTAG